MAALRKFEPHPIQADELPQTIGLFVNGFPPHQVMIYNGKTPILACGYLSIGDDQWYSWTVFGKHFKPIHYRFFLKYANNYLMRLNYRSAHHLVYKDNDWSKKMIYLLGYRYVRDEVHNGNQFEHWIKL